MAETAPLAEIGIKSIPPDDQILILELYKRYRLVPNEDGTKPTIPQTCRKVSEKVEYPPDVVYRIAMKLMQTPTEAATTYLKSRAVKMAKRVVLKGNPSELIDVLSRSNIGVLAPKKEGGSDGGFFLTVNAQDCGAVKVGVVAGPTQPLQLEEHVEPQEPEPAFGQLEAYSAPQESLPEEEKKVYGPKQPKGNNRTYEQGRSRTVFGHRFQDPQVQATIVAARRRLAPQARRRSHAGPSQKVQGLQKPDGHTEK